MALDIVEGKLGEFGAYDVEFKEGKLLFKLNAHGPMGGVQADLLVSMDSKILIKAIKDAIPGQIDDAVLAILESVLAGL